MRINSVICDLCPEKRPAAQKMKFFTLKENAGRGAPKAISELDLCGACYYDLTLIILSLKEEAAE